MARSSCNAIAAAVLLLLLMAASVSCKEVAGPDIGNQEIFHVDYRGPETHTSFPPPKMASTDSKWKPSRKGSVGKHMKPVHA